MKHATGPELLLEFGVLRIIFVFRLLLSVKVIEASKELVEAVRRRQEFVAVAEVVLAELASDVALRFEHFGNGRILRL